MELHHRSWFIGKVFLSPKVHLRLQAFPYYINYNPCSLLFLKQGNGARIESLKVLLTGDLQPKSKMLMVSRSTNSKEPHVVFQQLSFLLSTDHVFKNIMIGSDVWKFLANLVKRGRLWPRDMGVSALLETSFLEVHIINKIHSDSLTSDHSKRKCPAIKMISYQQVLV